MSTTPFLDHVAAALADRLREMLPDGFTISVDDGFAVVAQGSSNSGYRWHRDPTPDGVSPEIVEAVARTLGTLDAVQDFVAEETRQPWPGTGTTLPQPFARLTGRTIELGFRDGSAEIRLPSIALDRLD